MANVVGAGFGSRHKSAPGALLASLEGLGRRAHNTQLNGCEVTPAFAAALIIGLFVVAA